MMANWLRAMTRSAIGSCALNVRFYPIAAHAVFQQHCLLWKQAQSRLVGK
jgi:hypothetical protein